MKDFIFFVALILSSYSCQRQIFVHATATGRETIEFHDEDHFILTLKNEVGRFVYKGRYHLQSDTLQLDFLPIRSGKDQLFVEDGEVSVQKIAAQDSGYLIHLTIQAYTPETGKAFTEATGFAPILAQQGQDTVFSDFALDFNPYTFTTTEKFDQLKVFFLGTLPHLIYLNLTAPGVYEIKAILPYHHLHRALYFCGNGLGRGPYIEMRVSREADQITEIRSLSSSPKVYRLRKKAE